jgi:hypothetical protein
MSVYRYAWRWKTMPDPWGPPGQRVVHPLAHRAGDRCRVLARGRLNSILVEFQDGQRVITSRYAVRRAAA